MSVEITIRFEEEKDADEFLRRFEHREIAMRASIIGERADLEMRKAPYMATARPSYHDLFITTKDIKRTSIFNLGYGLEVTCTRVGGWDLWDHTKSGPGGPTVGQRNPLLLAGEYEGRNKGLRLDVGGHVIVDSLTRERKKNEYRSPGTTRH